MEVDTAIVNTASETEAEVSSTGRPTAVFVGDVVLHAASRVNFQLPRVNRTSEPLVVSTGILSVGVAKGIVDMFFRSVDAKSLLGNFEFLGCIAVGQERKYPHLM